MTTQEAQEHDRQRASSLDSSREAADHRGGAADRPDGQRGVPPAPDLTAAVLPLGEAGAPRSFGGATQPPAGPQAERPNRPAAAGYLTSTGSGGRAEHGELGPEKGALGIGHRHYS